MFMWYIGSGIGHKVTNYIPLTRAGHATKAEVNVQEDLAADDMGDIEAEPHLDKYGADEDGDDGNGNEDVEDVDADEEADFGYQDSEDSKGEESKDEDDLDGEQDCVYEL